MTLNDILLILAQFLAAMLVISLHEFAHAFAAHKCGDDTAKLQGRMTLNPFKHFDLLGGLCFAVAGFGWAKPVPVNPNNFDNYKKGSFWTAIAGVLANYLSAFLFFPILVLVYKFILPHVAGTYLFSFLYALFSGLYTLSLSFCVFNLLPLHPLDGFKILEASNTKRGKVYWFLQQYGYYLLMALVVVHYLAGRIALLSYVDVLGYFLYFARNILGRPISLLWNWIFSLFGIYSPFI